MKTKKITVKNLHDAILLGMTYEDASKIALKGLKGLKCLDLQGAEELEEDWLEKILEVLVKKNDHSLKFKSFDERNGGGIINWWVTFETYQEDSPSIFYDGMAREWPEDDAIHDEDLLSQFVLDFYGIKEHAPRKLKKTEVEDRTREIKVIMADLERQMNELNSELERLSSHKF